ncbi:hypothetical protein BN844_2289 [Pseudomonas sp. SHC52]|nr:hypothetical protein BN844_2289 [Pseudomonas sp. SHC52]
MLGEDLGEAGGSIAEVRGRCRRIDGGLRLGLGSGLKQCIRRNGHKKVSAALNHRYSRDRTMQGTGQRLDSGNAWQINTQQ